ncbi:MAG: hypothetical protein M1826_004027 [Phylliscum demangeonii]|nr:MAG: hypothetical protein M1826_004027 [Phylliscum demangeonii]
MARLAPFAVTHDVLIAGLLLLSSWARGQSQRSTTSGPLSLTPSQYWDGNDGPWSTFGVQVGTPSQNLRLLPSTSGDALWAVLPEGCTARDPSNCGALRGATFSLNRSSTWSDLGLYQLPPGTPADALGYHGNAHCGRDTVTLGWQGDGLPTLPQIVAGIATKDFYLGSLGLSPHAVNFTTFNDPQPSMLYLLRNRSQIASRAWGYTAGAYYQQPRVFGSLTLGGYDASRFVANNVSFHFGADIARDLLVGLRAIRTDASPAPLLPTAVFAMIDSTVPHIWLPLDACRAFEQAFGLVWDNRTGLYPLSESTHAALVRQNANLTFTLAPSIAAGDGAPTVDIVMPYASFDLTASPPLAANSTRYFPLRRAANDSQYVLGRTFLQQAYVIADYDRAAFSVHQALFPATSVPQDLQTIHPPPDPSAAPGGRSGLSTAGIAGTAVAAAVVCGLVILLVWALVRRRRRRARRAAAEAAAAAADAARDPRYQKVELDTVETGVVPGSRQPATAELDTASDGAMLASTEIKVPPPLHPSALHSAELESPGHIAGGAAAHELPTTDVVRVMPELDGDSMSSAASGPASPSHELHELPAP